jgi:hypothetical protein
MTEALVEVINEVSEQVRERLVKHIQLYTYEWDYFPNKEYESGSGLPSFEFEQSYRWRGIKKTATEVSNELFNQWQAMTIDKSSGRHYENGKDMRKQMASMMNVDATVGHKKRRPYWDLFLEETDKTIDSRFKNKLKSMGFNVV